MRVSFRRVIDARNRIQLQILGWISKSCDAGIKAFGVEDHPIWIEVLDAHALYIYDGLLKFHGCSHELQVAIYFSKETPTSSHHLLAGG